MTGREWLGSDKTFFYRSHRIHIKGKSPVMASCHAEYSRFMLCNVYCLNMWLYSSLVVIVLVIIRAESPLISCWIIALRTWDIMGILFTLYVYFLTGTVYKSMWLQRLTGILKSRYASIIYVIMDIRNCITMVMLF